jgi:regulator of sigma E protease
VVKEDILSTTLWWPFHMLRQTYKGLLSFVTGKLSAKNLSGPIGILSITYEVASIGIPYLLYLMALLSINIAFLNILPIPLLDGGHIFFCLIEWIKGSPVSEELMLRFQYVGIALLLAMFSFATWNDLMRLL